MNTTKREVRSTTAADLRCQESDTTGADQATPLHTTRLILRELFGPPEARAFAVRYWDGSGEQGSAETTPAFTLVLRHPDALRHMLYPPSDLGLAEAYVRDDYDLEGDIEAAVGLLAELAGYFRSPLAMAILRAQTNERLACHVPTLILTPELRGLSLLDMAHPDIGRRAGELSAFHHLDELLALRAWRLDTEPPRPDAVTMTQPEFSR